MYILKDFLTSLYLTETPGALWGTAFCAPPSCGLELELILLAFAALLNPVLADGIPPGALILLGIVPYPSPKNIAWIWSYIPSKPSG